MLSTYPYQRRLPANVPVTTGPPLMWASKALTETWRPWNEQGDEEKEPAHDDKDAKHRR